MSKSTEFSGNNVNYYLVDIKDPKRLAPYQAECEDIIEALGMTFAEGCAFKAIWRSCAARTLGLAKKGQDPHGIYDAEKVAYYAKRMLAIRHRMKNLDASVEAEPVPVFNLECYSAQLDIPIVEPEDLMAEIAKLDGPKMMDRNRPYTGQAHTDQGVRGQQPITGLTLRDLNDCFIRAVLLSACHLVPKLYDEACKGENAKLNGGDLYGFNLDALDPIAIGQNLSCEVERVMGIFPNIPGHRPEGK